MESYMGMTEKIRILLVKRGNMSEAELARKLEILPQNFNRKMKRDYFTEGDLCRIAEVLNCDYEAGFRLRDTGEKI
jgi:IS30 family transposase